MKGGCNFPMGPLALLDLVGLDTSLAILDALYDEFRDPNYAAVPLLRRMVTAGQLGRKSGVGFYDYRKCQRRDGVDGRSTPPIEPPPTLARFRRRRADEDGLVGVGADLEPGTLLAAYRRACSRCRLDATARHRLVVARPARRAAARRPAGEPVAAPVGARATRSASTPRSTR